MGKRITLSEIEVRVLNRLFNEALNGYYSDANIAEMDGLEERTDALATRSVIQSVLKKIK